MRKSFRFLISGAISLSLLLFLIACGGDAGNPGTPETAAPPAASTEVKAESSYANLSGTLDTLFIDSAHFEQLGRPPGNNDWTFFRFYIDSSNYLTLAGWSANNGRGNFHGNNPTIPATPNIILLKSTQSTIKFGPGNFFGNLVLRAGQLRAIQLLLRSTHSKSVLFAPLSPADNNNQITYSIILSDKTSADRYSKNVVATGVSLNPSPPRNAE